MKIRFEPLSILRLFGLTLAVAFGHASAQSYSLTDLGSLGVNLTIGQAINNAGQVTGLSLPTPYSQWHAFLWSDGVMMDLHTHGEGYGQGHAINDKGEVAGEYIASPWGGSVQGFLFRAGEMHGLGTLGGYNSWARGLNNLGQVTGAATTAAAWNDHVFLYSDGLMHDLGTNGGSYAWGSGINDAGQVVGYFTAPDYHAFVYTSGAFIDLNQIGANNSWTRSWANAINNVGQVVGSKSPYWNMLAFIYDNGTFTYFGTLGGSGSYARGVNDLGEVVGESDTPTWQTHAFVTRSGGSSLLDLNSRIRFDDPLKPYVTLTGATAINNNGWIVANGEDSRAPGEARAYLLKPSVTQMLARLLKLVTGVGPGTSLADKVVLAQTYLSSADWQSSAEILSATVRQIRGLSGKGIDAAQATRLVAQISAIVRELEAM